ncbi:sulfotransferase family protein [Solwaraspora sp. WMMB335]|uniref:sulfotransferase family protein n=1 Tax=Solwaraspora sp. WMMB335 TaxID=3404118 RepID=UPI003B941FB6
MTGNRGTTDRLRRSVRGARAWARAVVPGPLGALPEFLIIGGQRCGTTSLHHYLAAHPQVRPATGKELQFFTVHHGRGLRWYRAHFPVRPPAVRSFEASPYYLFHPSVPARVSAALPQARFVALVRDPVERAYSHYLHTRSYGAEPLPFAEAVAAEEQRLADALRDGPDAPAAHAALRNYSYLSRGRYAEQLRRWHAHLPADRLLVLRSEDMYADPAAVYTRVLDFLGLDPFTPAAFGQHTRRADRGPGELTAELRERLGDYFAPHNAELAGLLGWPHTWPAVT